MTEPRILFPSSMTRVQQVVVGLAISAIAASVAALLYLELGWGRQDITFDSRWLNGDSVETAECRNIPIWVDGQLWDGGGSFVPRNIDDYDLRFEQSGDTGVLILTNLTDEDDVLRLGYTRAHGGFLMMGCAVEITR